MYSCIYCWYWHLIPNEGKALLANNLITFSIKGNPGFSNRPRSLQRNPPDYVISDKWVFGN